MIEDTADVLLVDDSRDDAAFVRSALAESRIPIRLRMAEDGVQALSAIYGQGDPSVAAPVFRPRLILLDLKMPRLDGLEVLRVLKANPGSRSLPVVVLSSSIEARDLAESYRLGANGYVLKPMDFDRFRESVLALGRYWLQFNQAPVH